MSATKGQMRTALEQAISERDTAIREREEACYLLRNITNAVLTEWGAHLNIKSSLGFTANLSRAFINRLDAKDPSALACPVEHTSSSDNVSVYTYRCKSCGSEFERTRKMIRQACPTCHHATDYKGVVWFTVYERLDAGKGVR